MAIFLSRIRLIQKFFEFSKSHRRVDAFLIKTLLGAVESRFEKAGVGKYHRLPFFAKRGWKRGVFSQLVRLKQWENVSLAHNILNWKGSLFQHCFRRLARRNRFLWLRLERVKKEKIVSKECLSKAPVFNCFALAVFWTRLKENVRVLSSAFFLQFYSIGARFQAVSSGVGCLKFFKVLWR